MEVIRRRSYFYLGHTFRKDGKPTYRERYLGKDVPKDIVQLKESFLRECLEESDFPKIRKIRENFQKEWRRYPESMKKKYLIDLSIDLTYNTNAIEGSKVTKEETEDIIKRNLSPGRPLDDVKETASHSKVFFEAIQGKKRLSASVLLLWHKKIFGETKQDIAGRFRDHSVKVGDYRAPDWQDLKIMMDDFFRWYRKNADSLNPVEFAARAHYKFEKMHPFGDGNGRIGRLIIAHILMQAKYPLMVIEYKKRKSYYRALEKDEDRFVQYFVKKYLKSFKKYS